jgi:hypothetical protein
MASTCLQNNTPVTSYFSKSTPYIHTNTRLTCLACTTQVTSYTWRVIDACRTVWAYNKQGSLPKAIAKHAKAAFTASSNRTDKVHPRGIASVAYAFAAHVRMDADLYANLVKYLSADALVSLRTQQLSRLAWAYARCAGACACQIINSTRDEVVRRGLHKLAPEDLGNMVFAFAAYPQTTDCHVQVKVRAHRSRGSMYEDGGMQDDSTHSGEHFLDSDSDNDNGNADGGTDSDGDDDDSAMEDTVSLRKKTKRAHTHTNSQDRRGDGHGIHRDSDKEEDADEAYQTVNKSLTDAVIDTAIDRMEDLPLAVLRQISTMILSCGLNADSKSKARSVVEFVHAEAAEPETMKREAESVREDRRSARNEVCVCVCMYVHRRSARNEVCACMRMCIYICTLQ